jgi:hypothetical protein
VKCAFVTDFIATRWKFETREVVLQRTKKDFHEAQSRKSAELEMGFFALLLTSHLSIRTLTSMLVISYHRPGLFEPNCYVSIGTSV